MYYAMVFIMNEYGGFNVRALRSSGYKSLNTAINAINRSKKQGYVKQLNVSKPVWNNLISEKKVESITPAILLDWS